MLPGEAGSRVVRASPMIRARGATSRAAKRLADIAAISRIRSGLELPCSSRKATDILILLWSQGSSNLQIQDASSNLSGHFTRRLGGCQQTHSAAVSFGSFPTIEVTRWRL